MSCEHCPHNSGHMEDWEKHCAYCEENDIADFSLESAELSGTHGGPWSSCCECGEPQPIGFLHSHDDNYYCSQCYGVIVENEARTERELYDELWREDEDINKAYWTDDMYEDRF